MTTPTKGNGGEIHQTTGDRDQTMTTAQGTPVADDQNSVKAGPRGPVLLEDHVMREKIFHFDHERIPERVVHARGYGAHGYFELTDPIPELSCADLFQRKGRANNEPNGWDQDSGPRPTKTPQCQRL